MPGQHAHRRVHRRATHLAWPLLALAALALLACQRKSDLPEYGAMPAFALTDQAGATFGSTDVKGKVVVSNFVYTTCTDACPLLSAQMRDLQERLKSKGLFA